MDTVNNCLKFVLVIYMLIHFERIVANERCQPLDNDPRMCVIQNKCTSIEDSIHRMSGKNIGQLICGFSDQPMVCCKTKHLKTTTRTITVKQPSVNEIDQKWGLSHNEHCQTPDRIAGTCISVNQCPSIIAFIKKEPNYKKAVNMLRERDCGHNEKKLFCCQLNESSNLLPQPGECGKDITDFRIIGGSTTTIGEFPWMAVLQYLEPNNTSKFHCGGVLINERYILTAAHCVVGHKQFQRSELFSVRLGEWDIANVKDCGHDFCALPVIDVSVEKVISHHMYKPKAGQHDIALLRLSRNILFTKYVRPICLPMSENMQSMSYDDIQLDVAGWGFTEKGFVSSKLLKVSVKGVGHVLCKSKYSLLGSGQLCAGGQKGFASCGGDSGGPLMTMDTTNIKSPYWYCAGIVSFGLKSCGQDGWPGVYTRVSAYTAWIVQNLHP